MEKKRLAVITGTRAEYGLLRPVILKLLKSNEIIPLVMLESIVASLGLPIATTCSPQ